MTIMSDDYLEFFGMFGENRNNNDNDEEFNKLSKEIADYIKYLKEGGESSTEMLNDYFKRVIALYQTPTMTNFNYNQPPPELLEIQNKIKKWTEDGLSPDELDNKINELYGEPIEVKLVEMDGLYFEEKTWKVEGDSLVTKHKELLQEEVDEMKLLGMKVEEAKWSLNDYSEPNIKNRKLNSLHDLTDITDIKPYTIEEEIRDMEKDLEKAVQEEEYEFAAELRDMITDLKEVLKG
jgi:hypothetical protein